MSFGKEGKEEKSAKTIPPAPGKKNSRQPSSLPSPAFILLIWISLSFHSSSTLISHSSPHLLHPFTVALTLRHSVLLTCQQQLRHHVCTFLLWALDWVASCLVPCWRGATSLTPSLSVLALSSLSVKHSVPRPLVRKRQQSQKSTQTDFYFHLDFSYFFVHRFGSQSWRSNDASVPSAGDPREVCRNVKVLALL